MESESGPSSIFAVLERERTRFWEFDLAHYVRPFVIYNHDAIPRIKRLSGVRPTSNYDLQSSGPTNTSGFQFFSNIFKRGLNPHYCERISDRLQKYDEIFIIADGRDGKGVLPEYLAYATINYPEIPVKIRDQKVLKVKKMSENRLFEIGISMIDPDSIDR